MNDLNNAFKRDISIMETVKKHSSVSLLPYLKVLDRDDYVDIMMKVSDLYFLPNLDVIYFNRVLYVVCIQSLHFESSSIMARRVPKIITTSHSFQINVNKFLFNEM